jgi:hypothetical protein
MPPVASDLQIKRFNFFSPMMTLRQIASLSLSISTIARDKLWNATSLLRLRLGFRHDSILILTLPS